MKWYPAPDGNSGVLTFDVPGAANVLHLRGRVPTRFAHIALHRADLTFARDCLAALQATEERRTVTAEALWRSAILHYAKCFAPPKVPAGRTHIDAHRIFKSQTAAMADHRMFLNIRNQQLAHDDGTHNFWSVGAAIAPRGAPRKVVRVLAAAGIGGTLDDTNIAKLEALIASCLTSAEMEFNYLVLRISDELEALSHEDLLTHHSAEMQTPKGRSR